MTHTVFETSEPGANGRRSRRRRGSVPNWTQGAFEGAGAIVSTPNDMLRYAK